MPARTTPPRMVNQMARRAYVITEMSLRASCLSASEAISRKPGSFSGRLLRRWKAPAARNDIHKQPPKPGQEQDPADMRLEGHQQERNRRPRRRFFPRRPDEQRRAEQHRGRILSHDQQPKSRDEHDRRKRPQDARDGLPAGGQQPGRAANHRQVQEKPHPRGSFDRQQAEINVARAYQGGYG